MILELEDQTLAESMHAGAGDGGGHEVDGFDSHWYAEIFMKLRRSIEIKTELEETSAIRTNFQVAKLFITHNNLLDLDYNSCSISSYDLKIRL
jgi:hypothetical protein